MAQRVVACRSAQSVLPVCNPLSGFLAFANTDSLENTTHLWFSQENPDFAFLPLVGETADTRLAAGKGFARTDRFAKGSPAPKHI